MAVTFVTPVDVTPATSGSWADVDVSAQPGYTSAKTGVIIHWVNSQFSDLSFGLRKNGSTDNRINSVTLIHGWAAVGLDSAGIFEAYKASSSYTFYLVGFFDVESVFFTNATDLSTATTGSYVDTDVSGSTGTDTVLGVFLEITNLGGLLSVRKKGSTDDRYNSAFAHLWCAIGVDASKMFQQKISSTIVDMFLVGYIKTEVTFNTNGIDISTVTTGSYQDLAPLSAGAIGGVIECYDNTGAATGVAVRKKGNTDDIYWNTSRDWALTGVDASRIAQTKIGATTMKQYEIAIFTVIPPTPRIYRRRLSPSQRM